MIDLYCERTAPGFWGEPLNLLSNGAFFFVALALWRHAAGHPRPRIIKAMAIAAAAIGVGSTVFHAIPTATTRLLDEAPIVAFEVSFAWLFVTRALGRSRAFAVFVIAVVLVATVVLRIAPPAFNGSLPYLPALAVLAWLTFEGQGTAFARWIGRAVVLFVVAVAVRSADIAACQVWPNGTHFSWHLLMSGVTYAAVRGLEAATRGPLRRAAAGN